MSDMSADSQTVYKKEFDRWLQAIIAERFPVLTTGAGCLQKADDRQLELPFFKDCHDE